MAVKTFFFLFLAFFTFPSFAQTEEEQLVIPDGLGLSNQMKYSYDISKKIEIFENWLNVDYRKGIFSTGIRFDIFQPNDPNPAINRGKIRYADIAYKYIKAELGDADEGFDITAGNYYALFGRGLVLKIYEDRNVRIDNNLLGVKISGRFAGFQLTALSGSAENSNAERKDIIHAVDLEYQQLKLLRLGASVATNLPQEEYASRSTLASIRMQSSIWNFDLYGEYGIKQSPQTTIFRINDALSGKAVYGNINFYLGQFSVLGEYKYYDNFAFTSNDGTVIYNTPPALRKDYTYILLNRHPSPLNQSNEQGYQVEANYSPDDETSFMINYGITKTLPSESIFQRFNNTNQPEYTQLKEGYVQGNKSWNEKFTTIAAFGYSEELSTNTKSITPVIEAKYYLDQINTFRFILEHQQTTVKNTSEQYYDDVVTVEYLRSPRISISLVGELQTKEPDPGRKVKHGWSFIQFGYKFGEHTDASILLGSRQAGNICIGGVCRYEPEFSGIEIKMITRI